MINLNDLKVSLRQIALTGTAALAFASCFGATHDKVQVELLAKNAPEGGKQYAMRLTNKGNQSIEFEALPDAGFAHSACTYGSIFATSVSHWNSGTKLWEPRDTFINGVKSSAKGELATHTFVLKPGHSLCAGWWADSSSVKSGEHLTMTVCTSFKNNSRCFASPSFNADWKAKADAR